MEGLQKPSKNNRFGLGFPTRKYQQTLPCFIINFNQSHWDQNLFKKSGYKSRRRQNESDTYIKKTFKMQEIIPLNYNNKVT